MEGQIFMHGTATACLLQLHGYYKSTVTRGYLEWSGYCVIWRDVTLYHAPSKPGYYRVLPDETISKNPRNHQ
eukprot:807109-Amorphochlora_amoeboformis.AAC.1